jgi:hypothetical protein
VGFGTMRTNYPMQQSISDESQFVKPGAGRPLRPEEAALIRALVVGVYPAEALEAALTESRVADMRDGGMGSVRFLGSGPFSMALVEAQYLDSDGVLVSIAVNADKQGHLFELDFWKVDFSPLKRYPNPSDVSARVTSPSTRPT